jgi:hypothetical protein
VAAGWLKLLASAWVLQATPVLYGFGDVSALNLLLASQIGNGAGHPDDPVRGAA